MKKLSDNEMYEVEAGAFSKFTLGVVAGVGVFIVGVIDGFLRPLKCHR